MSSQMMRISAADSRLLHAADADESITVTGQTPIYVSVPVGENLFDANGSGSIYNATGYYDPRTNADPAHPQRSINSFTTSQGPVYVATSAKSGTYLDHSQQQARTDTTDSHSNETTTAGSSGHTDPGNTIIEFHYTYNQSVTVNPDGSYTSTKSGSGDVVINPPQQYTNAMALMNRLSNDVATAFEHYLGVGSKSVGPVSQATVSLGSGSNTTEPADGQGSIDNNTLLLISQYLVNDIAGDIASDFGGITGTAAASTVAYATPATTPLSGKAGYIDATTHVSAPIIQHTNHMSAVN